MPSARSSAPRVVRSVAGTPTRTRQRQRALRPCQLARPKVRHSNPAAESVDTSRLELPVALIEAGVMPGKLITLHPALSRSGPKASSPAYAQGFISRARAPNSPPMSLAAIIVCAPRDSRMTVACIMAGMPGSGGAQSQCGQHGRNITFLRRLAAPSVRVRETGSRRLPLLKPAHVTNLTTTAQFSSVARGFSSHPTIGTRILCGVRRMASARIGAASPGTTTRQPSAKAR